MLLGKFHCFIFSIVFAIYRLYYGIAFVAGIRGVVANFYESMVFNFIYTEHFTFYYFCRNAVNDALSFRLVHRRTLMVNKILINETLGVELLKLNAGSNLIGF